MGPCPELSRSQVLVYGALAVALLLVGARAIRAEGGGGPRRPSDGGFDAGGERRLGGLSGGFSSAAGGPDVVVDVTGAVRRPGVYRLPAGARVTDAVERAGGATGGRRWKRSTSRRGSADGQQVLVPERGPGRRARRPRRRRRRRRADQPRQRHASSSSKRSTGSGR